MKPSELLSQPGAWCQGTSALDANGEEVDPLEEVACRWCAIGAMRRCGRIDMVFDDREALRAVIGRSSIVGWNDDPARTQAEVVDALRRAGL